MSNYLNSDNVKVFPCGGRSATYDPLARLTTEQNLISIINRLVDKSGFIVTPYDRDTKIKNSAFESEKFTWGTIIEHNTPYIININGYLFTIDNIDLIFDSIPDNEIKGNGYLIATINPQAYDGNFIQLSPTTSEGWTPQAQKIEVTNINGYTNVVEEDPSLKSKGSGTSTEYIKLDTDDGKYYKCDSSNAHNFLTTYNNSYTDSFLDVKNGSDDKFNGLRFYISSTAIIDTNSLTLFECRNTFSINDDGAYYKDNDNFYQKYNNQDVDTRYNVSFNGWYEYEDSKIKFETNKNGDHRSVSIDDGEL